jgi:hypothetical protein
MHLPLQKRRRGPVQTRGGGLRVALRVAHETYRQHSAAPAPAAPAPAPPAPPAAPAAPAQAQARVPDPAPQTGEAQPARGLVQRVRAAAPRLRAATGRSADRPRELPARRDDPDVLLDVPSLKIDEIELEVEDLRARVALEARVLDLLRLNVGADVSLARVDLDIKGVDAAAYLKVRLDGVTEIVARVLDTVDRNPQIIENLTRSLGGTLEELGSGTSRAVGQLGEGAAAAVNGVHNGRPSR